MPPVRRRRRRRPDQVVHASASATTDTDAAAILAAAPRSPRMPTHVPLWIRNNGPEAAREWAAMVADETRARIAELSSRAPDAVAALGPEAIEAWACRWDDPRAEFADRLAAERGEGDPLAPLPR